VRVTAAGRYADQDGVRAEQPLHAVGGAVGAVAFGAGFAPQSRLQPCLAQDAMRDQGQVVMPEVIRPRVSQPSSCQRARSAMACAVRIPSWRQVRDSSCPSPVTAAISDSADRVRGFY
jgi:hypothetical protein